MKFFAVFVALLSVAAAEEAKAAVAPLTYTLPYNGLYNAAGLYNYAAAAPAYTYAAAPAYTYAAAAPVVAAAPAPVAYPYAAAYAPYYHGSQYHAQDEFANLNCVKHEVGNTYGGVSGGYSYVDADGKLQTVSYVADGAGFRTVDSRLPVAPVYDGVAPEEQPVLLTE